MKRPIGVTVIAIANLLFALALVATKIFLAAQPPQVLPIHDLGYRNQVGSCSREPPCGDQCLGRSEDAHDNSMGTCDAR